MNKAQDYANLIKIAELLRTMLDRPLPSDLRDPLLILYQQVLIGIRQYVDELNGDKSKK